MRKNLRTRIPFSADERHDSSGGKGEIQPYLPIRLAGLDQTNLFPALRAVNAELGWSFARISAGESGRKYSGHHIADFFGVFIQGEGEARQIDLGHARKFHGEV